jgi:hypothetical protein
MNIPSILQNIPFFTHLTETELHGLSAFAEIKRIPRNEKIDIKNINSFGVVAEGLFELGQRTRGDKLYLAPGSFFGEIPFAVGSHAGILKTLKDSAIIFIKPDDIYKSLLKSYKGLKGCLRNIKGSGFSLISTGNDILKQKSKVITIFGLYQNSGNSMFTALMSLNLSASARVVILDASYSGNSIFNIFEKEIPPALAQKSEKEVPDDKSILDKLVNINEKLSLVNISSGSKIKVNHDIISPIIYILSKKFKYIIIDHSDYGKNYGTDYTKKILDISDIVLPVIKNIKDKSSLHTMFDSTLKDVQRVYYILNRFYEKSIGTFEGGYIVENLGLNAKENVLSGLKGILESNKPKVFNELTELITRERTGLAVQTNLVNSVFLSGFFSSLYEKDIKVDTIYSSSWSCIIALLYVLSGDQGSFERNFIKFFSEEKIKSLLEVTFPDEHVYKNGKINDFASNLAGDKRIEHYSMLPAVMLADHASGSKRIFSTGFVRDLFTSSFLLDIFEPQNITDSFYYSGYPYANIRPEDLLRTDIENIRSVSVNNKQEFGFGEKKMPNFFKGYIDNMNSEYIYSGFVKSKNDFVIDINTDKYNIKEILDLSKDICKDLK